MGECWPGPEFKFSKTVEVRWSCYDLHLCQRKIATDEIQEKKSLHSRERSNINIAALNIKIICCAESMTRLKSALLTLFKCESSLLDDIVVPVATSLQASSRKAMVKNIVRINCRDSDQEAKSSNELPGVNFLSF